VFVDEPADATTMASPDGYRIELVEWRPDTPGGLGGHVVRGLLNGGRRRGSTSVKARGIPRSAAVISLRIAQKRHSCLTR
jgi:hypothetical protein